MPAENIDISKLDFTRVAIIGCPGSGKTTFSDAIGKILLRPIIHLDKVLWKPDWQMLPYEDRAKIHGEIISRESWLIDGMWRSHLAERFARATLVIFLDYPRRTCVFRALKRRIKYNGKQRYDIADGCLEKLDSYFVKYIWNFRRNVRPQIFRYAADNPNVTMVTLTSPKQTENFLENLRRSLSENR